MRTSAVLLGLALCTLPMHEVLAGPRVVVTARTWSVSADGKTTETGSNTGQLVTGGPRRRFVLDAGLEPCSWGTASASFAVAPPAPPLLPPAPTVGRRWTIDVGLVGIIDGNVQLALHWTREDHGPRGSILARAVDEIAEFDESARTTVAMHPLDLVEQDAGKCREQRLLVGLTVEVREDPGLAGARFRSELWLEHADADGETTTRHLVVDSRQGESAPVALGTLRFPTREHPDAAILLDLKGQLLCRQLEHGTIEVLLDVQRDVRVAHPGSAGSGALSDGGRKAVRVQAGEVVRLDLPEGLGGQHGYSLAGHSGSVRSGPPTPGLPDGTPHADAYVDSWTYFLGHRDAIVVRVTPLP